MKAPSGRLSGSANKAGHERYLLKIAYNGAAHQGWQSQRNGEGIQDLLEKALAHVLGQPTRIHGAGRTDAGVHARGQMAHFDVTRLSIPISKIALALNAQLPPSIRVLSARRVPLTFHARFSSTQKTYVYQIRNGRILPPHEAGQVWLVPGKIDFPLLQRLTACLVGTHDFRAFSANRGRPYPDTVRTIWDSTCKRSGEKVIVRITGDGFLYRMVRLLVGGMIQVARGSLKEEAFLSYLQQPTQRKCGYCAPADGLTLQSVRYSKRI